MPLSNEEKYNLLYRILNTQSHEGLYQWDQEFRMLSQKVAQRQKELNKFSKLKELEDGE